MSEWSCSEVRERLPERVTGRLDGVDARRVDDHLRVCAGCAGETDLLAALAASRPEPPAGLEGRILQAVVAHRRPAGRPPHAASHRWRLAAAAAVVLALGTGLLWNAMGPDGDGGPLAQVALDPVPEEWMDDAVVAGAPVFDALTDDALATLLEEME